MGEVPAVSRVIMARRHAEAGTSVPVSLKPGHPSRASRNPEHGLRLPPRAADRQKADPATRLTGDPAAPPATW